MVCFNSHLTVLPTNHWLIATKTRAPATHHDLRRTTSCHNTANLHGLGTGSQCAWSAYHEASLRRKRNLNPVQKKHSCWVLWVTERYSQYLSDSISESMSANFSELKLWSSRCVNNNNSCKQATYNINSQHTRTLSVPQSEMIKRQLNYATKLSKNYVATPWWIDEISQHNSIIELQSNLAATAAAAVVVVVLAYSQIL